MMNILSLPCLLVIAFAAVLSAGCQPAGATVTNLSNPSSNADCYRVEFLGMTESSEVASTWRYRVQELSCAQKASSLILELPSCATVVDASPVPWEITSPDLPSQLSGIRWQTGSDFQDGEFGVTLTGSLQKGTTRAGVEGQNIPIGSVEGPVCKVQAVPGQTPAGVPIAKVKVQSANCRARPVGKSDKIVVLYRNQETEIVGRNEDPNNPWWYVKIPEQEGNCWLWGRTANTDGDVDGLPIVK